MELKDLIKLSMISSIGFILICYSGGIAKAEYDISISKQTGNTVAKDSTGKIVASGSDTDVIQKAVSQGGIITFDGNAYSITGGIYSAGKDLTFQGQKTIFNINTGSDSPGFYFGGNFLKTTSVSASGNTARIGDASGVSAGDLITICNNDLWSPQDYPALKTGETYLVKGVSENTLTLDSNVLRSYSNAEARIYKPATIIIDECTFIGTGAKDEVRAIKLEYCKNSKFTNCKFDKNGMSAIALYTCYGVDVSNNQILNSNMNGYGYGVVIADACSDILIKNNDMRVCRHCIASGLSDNYGENKNIVISGNTLYNGCNAVIDSHASTVNYEVTGNTVYCYSDQDGYQCAFDDNTKYSVFSNNKVYGAYGSYAIAKSLNVQSESKIITDNYIECNNIINNNSVNLGKLTISGNTIVRKDGSIITPTPTPIKEAPVSGFTSSTTSGNTPLEVQFTDTSTNSPTSWNWGFGDGTTSNEKNPKHIYPTAGTYTVTLTASNGAGSNTATRTNYITVTAGTTLQKPVARFWGSRTTGTTPLTIGFTDNSTNSPTKWNWGFGDGTTSNEKNPKHIYPTAGTYTVTLTASNGAGSNTATRTNYITVTAGTTLQKPVARFWGSRTTGTTPLTIGFTDNSTNSPTKWNWGFGDGTTSNKKNPKHKYLKAGTYTVKLTASNSAGSDTKVRTNYIKVGST